MRQEQLVSLYKSPTIVSEMLSCLAATKLESKQQRTHKLQFSTDPCLSAPASTSLFPSPYYPSPTLSLPPPAQKRFFIVLSPSLQDTSGNPSRTVNEGEFQKSHFPGSPPTAGEESLLDVGSSTLILFTSRGSELTPSPALYLVSVSTLSPADITCNDRAVGWFSRRGQSFRVRKIASCQPLLMRFH